MQPQQPYYGPSQGPAPGQTPYDFILNDQPSPKRSLLGGLGGGSKTQQIILIIGGVALLLLIIILGLAVILGNGNEAQKEALLVAQEQTEITRVASLASQQDSIAESTKDLALNTQLSIQSEQQDLIAFMQTHGAKIDPKQLALLQNPGTDQKLSAAATNSTYDSTFTSIMKDELTKYQGALQQTYAIAKNPQLRQLLQTDYADVGLLLQQTTANQ